MAQSLGLSLATVRLYERGERWDSGARVTVPGPVILALEALSARKAMADIRKQRARKKEVEPRGFAQFLKK